MTSDIMNAIPAYCADCGRALYGLEVCGCEPEVVEDGAGS